jgi:hypothetical protein
LEVKVNLVRVFEEPVVIIFSWMILIVGILGAARLIGAKMPTEGIMAGPGDLLRTS